jgi:hypothetical protein
MTAAERTFWINSCQYDVAIGRANGTLDTGIVADYVSGFNGMPAQCKPTCITVPGLTIAREGQIIGQGP